MALIQTRIGDKAILLEAETTSAFSKSELEERPDPEKAMETSIDLLATLAAAVANQVGDAVPEGGSAEVSFGIKVDAEGQVCVAKSIDDGQLKCVVRYDG